MPNFFIYIFLLTPLLCGATDKFHQVIAQQEETPLSLLQKYDLDKYECNISQFKSLNQLKTGENKLVPSRKYFLPIILFDYDGKSIRSTLNISEWEQAVRIKKYNDMLLKEKLRSQNIVDSRILWVPYHELYCLNDKPAIGQKTFDVVPSNVKGTRRFPIFGSKYESVPKESDSMKGKVFYIVSGHGGPDVGAIGKKGNTRLCEDEYAYDVCLRLTRNLLAHGATAYMIIRDPNDGIRDEKYLKMDYDEYCWGNYTIPRSQKMRLRQRAQAINTLSEKHQKQGVTEQYVITIHLDSRNLGERTDVFFYHHPSSDEGRQCAEIIHSTLAEKYGKYRKYGSYTGTVSARDLHMLREVKPTSVFIELGNIRNKYDQLRFILTKNRQYLADWIAEGLKKF